MIQSLRAHGTGLFPNCTLLASDAASLREFNRCACTLSAYCAVMDRLGYPPSTTGLATMFAASMGYPIAQNQLYWSFAQPVALELNRTALFVEHVISALSQSQVNALSHLICTVQSFSDYSFQFLNGIGLISSTQRVDVCCAEAPYDAIGCSVLTQWPHIEDQPLFHRSLNELQMLLHASDLNIERKTNGQPLLDTIWFWGAGTPPAPLRKCQYDCVVTDDPIVAAMAQWSRIQCTLITDTDADMHAPHKNTLFYLTYVRDGVQLKRSIRDLGLSDVRTAHERLVRKRPWWRRR